MASENDTHCALCGRRGVRTTRHHLIPRRTHRLKRIRKRFERTDRLGRILHICRPCHSHIHAVLNERELAEVYNTRADLLSHPDIMQFVTWIADKPPGFRPAIRRPKSRRSIPSTRYDRNWR